MITIKQANNLVTSIIGCQEIDTTKKYRYMTFLVKYNYNDKSIIFNTLTEQIIVLENSEIEQINKFDSGIQTFLIKNWFLVPENFDDNELQIKIKQLIALVVPKNNNDITNYTILTTTDCNARCYYCFEHGKKIISMDAKTANDCAEFIKKSCNKKKVGIRWFGGEPLFNSQVIDIVSKKLKEYNIEYSSSMVTNAYLFDEENIKKATELWNLKKIQVTLDGTENNYNRIKAYVNTDENPYKRVLKNITRLLNADIAVDTRLHFNSNNFDDIRLLMKQLLIDFGSYKKFAIKPHIIFHFSKGKRVENSDIDKLISMYEELLLMLEEYEKLPNFDIKKIYDTSNCMADNDSTAVIFPDGSLGKCNAYVDTYKYGNIYSNGVDAKIINLFKESPSTNLCNNCNLRIVCRKLLVCINYMESCYSYKALRTIEINFYLRKKYNDYKNTLK